MKERPILFSAPMVRAILEDRKTQTRRIIKPQPERVAENVPWTAHDAGDGIKTCFRPIRSPYGSVGDQLWVRETWRTRKEWDGYAPSRLPIQDPTPKEDADWCREEHIEYRFLNVNHVGLCKGEFHGKWRPSIHMPRWASRITLEITKVRVERLRDISEGDAKAEGVEPYRRLVLSPQQWSYIDAFAVLWDSINGKGAWDANPWVWVLAFKRV